MILLKKIILKDFLSHEETHVDFGPTDQILIDGASGAGKSSLFDAIVWALYGQGRVDNRSLVRRGAKKATVRLELTQNRPEVAPPYDTQTIIIERSASPKGKHDLSVSIMKPENLEPVAHSLTGVRELQNWIDKDLIGASYLLFVNSVAYVQGNTDSFVSQTAPKRKELLLEIVKAEDYSKHYESARQKLSGLAGEELGVNNVISRLEAHLTTLRARTGDRPSLLKDITDNTEKLIKDIVPKKSELERQKAEYMAANHTIEVLNRAYTSAVLDANNTEKSLIKKTEQLARKQGLIGLLASKPKLLAEVSALSEKLSTLRIKFADFSEKQAQRAELLAQKPTVVDRSGEISRCEKQLEAAKNGKICPSGDSCPHQAGLHESITYNTNRIAELIGLNVKENVALAEWAIKVEELPQLDSYKTVLSDISSTESALRIKENELSRLESTQKELDTLIEIEKEVPALSLELVEKTAAAKAAQKQKEDAELATNPEETNRIANALLSLYEEERQSNEKIARAKAGLEAIERDEKDILATEANIKSLQGDLVVLRENARRVGLVKDAFGAKGIETLVIDYLLPKLEDRINEVLTKLSDFRVRLDTQKKSADGETLVEGLFITILNELGEEMPFEAYSGGEKLKISVAISESLATLQKVGFRLFDETFLGLDENSTESFSDVLVSLQQRFGQVLCISHLQQIKDLFDKKVVIRKNNGISYVSNT